MAYRRIWIINVEGNRKYPLVRHSNNCYRQDPVMATKISGWKFEEKWDVCRISEYLFQDLNCKGKRTLPWINLAHTTLTKRREHHLYAILTKMHNLNRIVRKHRMDPKYLIIILQKYQMSKTRIALGIVTD